MDIFGVIFGFASLILGIMTYKLNSEKDKQEKTLEVLQEYAKNTIMFDYTYVDAIVIGPKDSGKTSIIQLWINPWTDINEIEHSSVWQKYEKDLYEFDEETRVNPDISIEQTYQPVLRLRVHDYPGENQYRVQAIKKLKEIGDKVVLVFVFHVAFVNDNIENFKDNATYFNLEFTQTIGRHVDINKDVAKAIVVFNKGDLLPEEWDDVKSIQEIRKANHDALYQIERVFNNPEYHLTSALTNKGLIKLLGSIGAAGVESKHELKSFKKKFEQLEKRYGTGKG